MRMEHEWRGKLEFIKKGNMIRTYSLTILYHIYEVVVNANYSITVYKYIYVYCYFL